MKVIILCTVLFFALDSIPVASAKCKPDEVEICSKIPLKGCFCKTCISCPEAYGPSHQCGGRYWNGTIITCKPCINGVSYSKEYSISSCEPCHQCGGRETLKRCTPKSETSCGTKCRVGYIMNQAVEECVPDTSFMETSQQTNTAKLTTHLPEITIIPKTTTSTTTTKVRKLQRETDQTSRHTSLDTSGRNGQPKGNKDFDHSRDNKIILLVISIVIFIIIMVFLAYVFHKRSFHHFAMNQDEKKALNKKDSTPRSSLQVQLRQLDDLCLSDIPEALKSEIVNLISGNSKVVKGWRDIGEMLKLDSSELRAIDVAGQKKDTTYGEHLFTSLASCQPELTVTEFVKILENLRRKDVIKTITTYYNINEIKSAGQDQIEESQV